MYEGFFVVILSCNCISRLTSNLDVPINRTCKCLPKTRERIIRFRPSISLCRALFCLLVHAIMLFAKKGSLFSLQFFLLPPCYTCHHFHGSRVGKFISVSVTICMMMCLLKAFLYCRRLYQCK